MTKLKHNKNTAVTEPAHEKPWRFDDSKATFKAGLTKAEEKKYDEFKGHVSSGTNPHDAAALVGGMDYKQLSDGRYQGRLSKGNRFTTQHDESDPEHNVVRVHQVGGHT